jgi:hypothetical protein
VGEQVMSFMGALDGIRLPAVAHANST